MGLRALRFWILIARERNIAVQKYTITLTTHAAAEIMRINATTGFGTLEYCSSHPAPNAGKARRAIRNVTTDVR
jgi:hypothetical protein